MTLSNKHILFITIFILLLTLGGYYFLFSIIESKNKNTFLLSQEIDTYAQNESMRRQNNKVTEEEKDKIEKIDTYFVHKNEVVPFIETVEDAGKKTGVVVTIGTVSATEDSTFTLRLDAHGSWSDVNRFLLYLENLPYKVTLSKVDLNKASSVERFYANVNADGNVKKATPVSPVSPVWNAIIEISVLTLK